MVEKIDILITIFGIAAYMAIMMDLRSYEQKLAQYEEIQEKRRLYSQRVLERRKAERARELAAERRAARQQELAQLSGVVEKLGSMEDAEVMRKSRITSGKVNL